MLAIIYSELLILKPVNNDSITYDMVRTQVAIHQIKTLSIHTSCNSNAAEMASMWIPSKLGGCERSVMGQVLDKHSVVGTECHTGEERSKLNTTDILHLLLCQHRSNSWLVGKLVVRRHSRLDHVSPSTQTVWGLFQFIHKDRKDGQHKR